MVFFFCASETVPSGGRSGDGGPTHPHACSLSQPPEKKKIKLSCQPGGREKKSTSFPAGPRLGFPVSHPPRLIPCSACRAALGPPTFTLFGKVESRIATCPLLWQESPPFHTAEHTERMAATPLRPRHRCEAHTHPHHSWRQRKPCVKISHPLVDGADTTRLVEKPFPRQWRSDAGQWRTMSSPPGRRSRRRPRGAARRSAGARRDGEVWKGDK